MTDEEKLGAKRRSTGSAPYNAAVRRYFEAQDRYVKAVQDAEAADDARREAWQAILQIEKKTKGKK